MHNPVVLDTTASFSHITTPTPFGLYDANLSFQTDANGLVKLANASFGGSVLNVEIANRDVYSCLEQAVLEYSFVVNSYHAKSILANVLGTATGSLTGHQNKLPRMDLNAAKKMAAGFSQEAGVGGERALLSASISLTSGVQHYNLNVLLSSSGVTTDPQKVEVRDMFHFSPTAAYRFFDTTSAVNYLHNQFSFESFTPETVFYLLPIWEDVLRAQQLEQSHRIRRSNYSYNIVNNVLTLYPVPTATNTMHFTYYLVDPNASAFDASNPTTNGVSNLSNVPFGNIDYNAINSIGRQWIRRFALALSKDVLGQVRGKVASIPIPNGDLTLNGSSLISEAQVEKENLRLELKELFDSMTYDKLAQQEADKSENLKRQLALVPMGIWVG